jgi:hypothetical protein
LRSRSTYLRSPSSLSSSDGHAIEAFSNEILGASKVFFVISGAARYFATLLMEMYASIRSVVSSGMTARVTSRLPKTPMAVKATDGVNFPYWSAYTASAVADRRIGLVIQQLD